jgi:hypothetical protein
MAGVLAAHLAAETDPGRVVWWAVRKADWKAVSKGFGWDAHLVAERVEHLAVP